jgi:ribonuclease J
MNPNNQQQNSGAHSSNGNKPFVKKWFPRNNQQSQKTTSPGSASHASGSFNRMGNTQGSPNAHNTRTHVSHGGNFRKPFEQPKVVPIPPLAKGDIRIIPIGGVEEITKNMTLVEYDDQIVIIDAGIKMGDSGPGITTTIPDITYLEQRKHLIKAIVITHGHFDHVAAIPFVIEKLGNPPIYTREFGAMIIKKRQEEHPNLAPLNIHIVDKEAGSVTLSQDLKVRFFGLTHSIPDSTGVIIETPYGDIVSTGDVRVENIEGVPVASEVEQYKFFKDRNVLLMTMDSTGIPVPGWSLAESIVATTIDKLIAETKGRILIAAFASQVERLIKFIESAKKYGRYVVVEGRSMKGNIGIVKHLGLTNLDHVIDVEEMHKYPINKILILATGAQGEEYSLLDRVSRGTHKFIKLTEHDTLIFSASVVPGNERSVDELKDRIYRCNPRVITYADTQVHSSGHGKRDELAWIHTQVNYKFFMPIHGSHYRLKMHRDLALTLKPEKTKDDIIVPDDGTIIEIREKGTKLVRLQERAPHDRIVIDGTYIGPVQEAILRDRTILSEEGFIQVVVAINQRTGKLYKSPDIISRGFIYLRNNQELLHKVRVLAKKTAEDSYAEKGVNIEMIKDDLTDKIKRVLTQKTGKRPLIIAVVLIF